MTGCVWNKWPSCGPPNRFKGTSPDICREYENRSAPEYLAMTVAASRTPYAVNHCLTKPMSTARRKPQLVRWTESAVTRGYPDWQQNVSTGQNGAGCLVPRPCRPSGDLSTAMDSRSNITLNSTESTKPGKEKTSQNTSVDWMQRNRQSTRALRERGYSTHYKRMATCVTNQSIEGSKPKLSTKQPLVNNRQ